MLPHFKSDRKGVWAARVWKHKNGLTLVATRSLLTNCMAVEHEKFNTHSFICSSCLATLLTYFLIVYAEYCHRFISFHRCNWQRFHLLRSWVWPHKKLLVLAPSVSSAAVQPSLYICIWKPFKNSLYSPVLIHSLHISSPALLSTSHYFGGGL